MGADEIINTGFPHFEFGDPACSGLLRAFIEAGRAYIICQDCGKLIQSLAESDLRRVLHEMELTLDLATELCPHCGAANLFPGSATVAAYICVECAKRVIKPPIE